jgi:PAS domain S-box-containing protein
MAKARKPSSELRKRAEQLLGRAKEGGASDDVTVTRVVHELEVHQVELDMQNEELRISRRDAESALERYAAVFEYAPIGYATTDHTGTISAINRVGARLLGGSPSQFNGKLFQAFITTGGLRVFNDLLANILATSTSTSSCELELRRDGDIVPVRLTVAAFRRVEPTLLITFEDITERKLNELELTRAEATLRELNQRKDDFMAMLSHELRNPLAPIRTSVAVLQLAEPGSEAATSAVAIIDRATTHMTRMVDDLLDITRITRGTVQLRREPMDLVAVLERAVDDLRDGFKSQRIELETGFEERGLWMNADPARVVQAVSNVLGNAKKFTPRGGKVTITVTFEAPFAIVRIVDNGIGIDPTLVDNLFEPFAQGPQHLDRSTGGLGLGLALVKSLVELHGGTVQIRSDGPGKGTEVVIRLPAQRQHVEVAPVEPWRAGERRRVLIIEDRPDTAQSLLNALVLMGHEVRAAYSGQARLELIESYQPDVVLCDLGLPDMDGYSLADRVRHDPKLSATYMVALSGYARPDDVARAFAAGFHRHIAKPPQIDELDELIGRVPDRHRGTHSNALH